MDEEIQALIEQLADPQFSARKVAARKLERLEAEAAPLLRQALHSANPIVLSRVAQLLGQLGDSEAAPRLRELLGAGDVDVSGAAHDALLEIARRQQSAEARDRMLAELRRARKSAPSVPLLPDSATPAPAVPRGPAPTSLRQAQRRAALTLPESIGGLVATLGHGDYQKRSAATKALVARGSEAVGPLCAALEERSPVVRQRAAEALGRIQDVDALIPLLNLLRREAESLSAETSVLIALRDAIMLLIRGAALRPYTTLEAIAIVRLVSHQAVMGLPQTLFVGAANRLRALAAEAPSPELRSALPHLKGIWPFVPREFSEARKAIEEATKAWADLPIASVEPASPPQNLPLPATETPAVPAENLPRPTSAKPPPLPTDIDGLIEALNSHDDVWCRRVEGALFIKGTDAVLPLRWGFVHAATPAHKARIAGVLSGIGDPEALVTLWVAWREGLEEQAGVSLRTALLRIGAKLPVLYDRNHHKDLLYLLTESREVLPALAAYVARALERRAQEQPTPELRLALPLLRGTWLHPAPPVLDSARLAIEKATAAWADLPIAADRPEPDAQGLPRPAGEPPGPSTESLPRPTEDSA